MYDLRSTCYLKKNQSQHYENQRGKKDEIERIIAGGHIIDDDAESNKCINVIDDVKVFAKRATK